jgi:4-hydroxy-tetrahydrodipicolinate reductase
VQFALVGYGRMGRAIEGVARERGHELVAVVDPEGGETPSGVRRSELGDLAPATVAFEFTGPSSAESNVIALLGAGVAVVSGSTGWEAASAALCRAVKAAGVGAVVAPNFSVGMNLFYAVVEQAARLAGASGLYEPFVVETHHRGKLDAPSGTAARLAELLREAAPSYSSIQVGCPAEGAVSSGTIHLASVRAGHEPGRHTVGFDGVHDSITLTHAARGRGGFALGAVLAAEWIAERRGLHGFDEVVRDLVEGGDRA